MPQSILVDERRVEINSGKLQKSDKKYFGQACFHGIFFCICPTSTNDNVFQDFVYLFVEFEIFLISILLIIFVRSKSKLTFADSFWTKNGNFREWNFRRFLGKTPWSNRSLV